MSAKRKQEKEGLTDYRAALMIDLKGSTFAWGGKHEIAKRMIQKLEDCLNEILNDMKKRTECKVGNFTGDGFLVLFTNTEGAINFTAKLIESWEEPRKRFLKSFDLPEDSKFFILRTGMEYGNIYKWKKDYVGTAISRAQRCEAASKKYIESCQLNNFNPPEQHFQVFITNSAMINTSRGNYYYSDQLEAEFEGINEREFIYAVWPKAKAVSVEKTADPENARKAAQAISSIDAAERLMEEAGRYTKISKGGSDRKSRVIIEKAIDMYTDVLKDKNLSPNILANANVKMGVFLDELSTKLSPKAKRMKLDEAISHYREALKNSSIENTPADYAMAQSNMGITLSKLAKIFRGNAREEKISEAELAFKEALKVYNKEDYPKQYKKVIKNLQELKKTGTRGRKKRIPRLRA